MQYRTAELLRWSEATAEEENESHLIEETKQLYTVETWFIYGRLVAVADHPAEAGCLYAAASQYLKKEKNALIHPPVYEGSNSRLQNRQTYNPSKGKKINKISFPGLVPPTL